LKINIKESSEKNLKQEKYTKLIHEKIGNIESSLKKLSLPRGDINKKFTKEDLKATLEKITSIKNSMEENKLKYKNLNKLHDEKLHQLASLNKKQDIDYKDTEKVK
jgi:hypothetical protein